MLHITIRTATLNDAPEIWELMRSLFEPREAPSLPRIEKHCECNLGTVVVHNTTIVAAMFCAMLRSDTHEVPGGVSTIITFGVSHAYAGRGIGRAMLNSVTSYATVPIYLHCRTGNAPALHLYTSAGFTIVKTLPAYYTRSTDTPDDAYYMVRHPDVHCTGHKPTQNEFLRMFHNFYKWMSA